ncbi:MAG TPA: HlyD family secretion protein [Verrucomicrobiae bacterium]|nr:HlyD family secretion protein [Verrucomicrobiae bacterium]
MTAVSAAPNQGANRSKRKTLAIVGLVLLLGLGYFGFTWYMDQRTYVTTENAKISGDIINASAKIAGKVADIKVTNGAQVKKGDVLFSLEPEQMQAQLNQAEGALDVAKAQLAKAAGGARSEEVAGTQAAVDGAQASYSGTVTGRDNLRGLLNDAQVKLDGLLVQMAPFKNPAGTLDAAYAIQQLDGALAAGQIKEAQYTIKVQSIQALFASKAQLEAQIEQLQGQLKTLDAQVSAAKAGLDGAKSKLALVNAGASNKDIAIIEAQVRAAQAAYDMAKLNLSYAEIKAPMDGTVVQVNVHTGDIIAPGQSALALVDFTKLQVTAYVLENDLQNIKANQEVKLLVDAYSGQALTGIVKEVGLATASTFNLFSAENASGNYTKVSQRIPIKISIDPAGNHLIPGMSVTAKIKIR